MNSIHRGRIAFQGNAPAGKSPMELEREKVVIKPDQEKRLANIITAKGLAAKGIDLNKLKEIYREERAVHNLLAKHSTNPAITDDALLQEFETRNWDQTIGPRS